MLVSDLRHFLDLPDDVPGPARRLAQQLGAIVRAGTAGDAGPAWQSALPCRRRPGRRACPGRVVVARSPDGPIRWQCSACGDAGPCGHQSTTASSTSISKASAAPIWPARRGFTRGASAGLTNAA